MNRKSRTFSLAIFGLTLAGLAPAGCGSSGPAMAPVSGVVTYNGKLVTQGTVTFVATAPQGRNGVGPIDSTGKYTLQTDAPGDGALIGEYVVTIFAHEEPILDYIPKKPVPPKYLVPSKYEKPETSGLKAVVVKGQNPRNFTLID